MRPIPQAAIDLIKTFEGFSSIVYKCPAGIDTFGYGSLLKNYPDVQFPITEAIGEECLKNDLTKSANAVNRLINVCLSDNQFAALIDFTYNLGSGALQRSTLRAKLNRSEYNSASDEFMRYVFASGRKLSGLVKRRYAEQQLYLS